MRSRSPSRRQVTAKLEEASVATQPASLYERLGGIYVIATAVDDFISTGIPARETALSRATRVPVRDECRVDMTAAKTKALRGYLSAVPTPPGRPSGS